MEPSNFSEPKNDDACSSQRLEFERMIKLLEAKLYRCAHINSHKVRGPVARIMGLVGVSTLDERIDCKWFFEQIKREIVSIDKITRRVTKALERIDETKSKVMKRPGN